MAIKVVEDLDIKIEKLFLRLLILSVIFVVPLIFYVLVWQHYHTPKEMTIRFLVVLALAVFLSVKSKIGYYRNPYTLPILIYVFAMGLGCLVAVTMTESVDYIVNQLMKFIYVWLAYNIIRTRKDIHLGLAVISFTSLLVSLYGISQYYYNDPFDLVKNGEPVSTLGNVDYAGQYHDLAIPLIFAGFFISKDLLMKLFFLASGLLTITHLIMTKCKGALLGFLLIFPVMLVIYLIFSFIMAHKEVNLGTFEGWKRFLTSKIVVRTVAIVLVFIFIGFPIFKRTKPYEILISECTFKNPGIMFRFEVWKSAAQNILIDPWLGIGPGNFKVIHLLYTSKKENEILGKEVLARKVHNEYMATWLENGGIWALIALFWIMSVTFIMIKRLFFMVHNSIRKRALNEDIYFGKLRWFNRFTFYYTLGSFGALAITYIHSFFCSNLLQPGAAITFWYTTAILAVIYRIYTKQDRKGLILRPISKENNVLASADGSSSKIKKLFLNANTPKNRLTRIIICLIIAMFVFSLLFNEFLSEYYQKLGMVASNYQRYERMFELFDKAIGYYPWQMELYYILNRYCIDAGEYEKGVDLIKKDLYMNPNYKWAHNNLGVCYDRLGETELARKSYQKALAVDPYQVYAHFNIGIGHMKEGKWEKAIERFRKTLESEPGKYSSYKYIATCYLKLQKVEEAIKNFDLYLLSEQSFTPEEKKDLWMVYEQLGTLYLDRDESEKSLNYLEKALLSQPRNSTILKRAVSARLKLGKYENAAAGLEELVRISPRDASVWYSFGLVKALTKDFDQAIHYLKTAISIGGEDYRAKILADDALDLIKDHPRYKELLQ